MGSGASSGNVREWDTERVAEEARSLELGAAVEKAVLADDVDGETLVEMSEESIKDIEGELKRIGAKGMKKKRAAKAIAALNNAPSSPREKTETPPAGASRPIDWDAFLSHSKKHEYTETLARSVKRHLKARGYANVFFDKDDLRQITLENLKHAIVRSAVVILVLDDLTLESEWCRDEIKYALEAGVPVHVLVDKDRFPDIGWKMERFEKDGEMWGDGQHHEGSLITYWRSHHKPVCQETADSLFGSGSYQVIDYQKHEAPVELHIFMCADRPLTQTHTNDVEIAYTSIQMGDQRL